MAEKQVAGLLPWSWCMAIGMLRVQLGRGQHQVAQVVVLRVGARAARGLDDDRRVGLRGRLP